MPLIIFDCDGVIIDSEYLACSFSASLMNDLGFPITLEEYIDKYMGKSDADRIADMKAFGIKEGLDSFIETSASKLKKPEFLDNLKGLPDIEIMLDKLKHPYCIASASPYERLYATLDKIGVLHYFKNNIFSAEDVAKSKPAPDVFLYAAEKMGFAPSDCIVIEDSHHGVKGGVAAGMDVYGFTGGTHMNEKRGNTLLEAGAKRLFSNMKDLLEFLNSK